MSKSARWVNIKRQAASDERRRSQGGKPPRIIAERRREGGASREESYHRGLTLGSEHEEPCLVDKACFLLHSC